MCTQCYYSRADQISAGSPFKVQITLTIYSKLAKNRCIQVSFAHFRPEKGAAVFWHNIHRSGHSDMHMLHAGCPVLAGKKKGAAVFWHSIPLSGQSDLDMLHADCPV
jgi:hypothetical protein